MIVLDTDVVSELLRPRPDPQVEAWLAAQDAAAMFFTTIGEAELRLTLWMCRDRVPLITARGAHPRSAH
jgi:predicted nucleic acid-binding protein